MAQVAIRHPDLPATILRLPDRESSRTASRFGRSIGGPLAVDALHPSAAGRVYNVAEEHTPTIGARPERLQILRLREIETPSSTAYNYTQDIAYNTARIRQELGFRELVGYDAGLRRAPAAAAITA